MITKQFISSLFLLTILVANVQRGVSLKCYVCSTDDEKNDCWTSPDKLEGIECGESNSTENPSTTAATTPTAAATTPTAAATTPTAAATTPTAAATTVTPAATTPTAAATTVTAAATTVTAAATTPTAAATNATAATTTPTAAATNATAAATTATAAATTPTEAAPPLPKELQRVLSDFFQEWKKNNANSRTKRDVNEWECAKIITKNKDNQKKTLERKCVKKSDETCKNKANDSDNICAVCSDKNLCNSASNIKLQLIPAFLSVFLALFFSSQ